MSDKTHIFFLIHLGEKDVYIQSHVFADLNSVFVQLKEQVSKVLSNDKNDAARRAYCYDRIRSSSELKHKMLKYNTLNSQAVKMEYLNDNYYKYFFESNVKNLLKEYASEKLLLEFRKIDHKAVKHNLRVMKKIMSGDNSKRKYQLHKDCYGIHCLIFDILDLDQNQVELFRIEEKII